jgi:putative Holliday junction resolvase
MGRILAIDYGQKRVGIAVTDDLQLIANGLITVHSKDIISFLKNYVLNESVEIFIVGEPKQMNNMPSESVKFIDPFIKVLKKTFPLIPVYRIDERFTSKMASQTMLTAGLRKTVRQNKSLVDTISATIILQSFLESRDIFNSK